MAGSISSRARSAAAASAARAVRAVARARRQAAADARPTPPEEVNLKDPFHGTADERQAARDLAAGGTAGASSTPPPPPQEPAPDDVIAGAASASDPDAPKSYLSAGDHLPSASHLVYPGGTPPPESLPPPEMPSPETLAAGASAYATPPPPPSRRRRIGAAAGRAARAFLEDLNRGASLGLDDGFGGGPPRPAGRMYDHLLQNPRPNPWSLARPVPIVGPRRASNPRAKVAILQGAKDLIRGWPRSALGERVAYGNVAGNVGRHRSAKSGPAIVARQEPKPAHKPDAIERAVTDPVTTRGLGGVTQAPPATRSARARRGKSTYERIQKDNAAYDAGAAGLPLSAGADLAMQEMHELGATEAKQRREQQRPAAKAAGAGAPPARPVAAAAKAAPAPAASSARTPATTKHWSDYDWSDPSDGSRKEREAAWRRLKQERPDATERNANVISSKYRLARVQKFNADHTAAHARARAARAAGKPLTPTFASAAAAAATTTAASTPTPAKKTKTKAKPKPKKSRAAPQVSIASAAPPPREARSATTARTKRPRVERRQGQPRTALDALLGGAGGPGFQGGRRLSHDERSKRAIQKSRRLTGRSPFGSSSGKSARRRRGGVWF